MRAAGKNFIPGSGFSAGVFVPFYVNDRLVVRAEAGLAGHRSRQTEGETLHTEYRMEATATALGRFYLDRKVSLSLGIQGVRALGPGATITADRTVCTLRRADILLLMGAAYRWSDRVETGFRYGQGLLPAAELPVYGIAHRRYAHLTMSYLIHGTTRGFTARRKWRSGLSLAHRY